MFTVVYTPAGGDSPDDDVTVVGVNKIEVNTQLESGQVESVRIDNVVILPAASIVSIDVTANIST